MTIRNANGKVPWSALTYYAEGRCGLVGCCHASDTPEQALEDAKQWHRDHPPRPSDNYLSPTCRIEIGYCNIIDGSRS